MTKNKGGRPSKYTEALGKEICARIMSGRTTLSVSKDEDMPNRSTIVDWAQNNPEFSIMYAQARDKLYQHWADEIMEDAMNESRDYQKRKRTKISDVNGKKTREIIEETVSDNTAVQRDRLKVDSMKWLLSKLRPREYGDKIEQQITGKDGAEFQPILNITIEKKG